jgi:hypothetical protein
MTSTNFSGNGNGSGNGSILGRGIKHRDLTHGQLVGLAADAVSGALPVVPSIQQAPFIFEGVSRAEISAELKRRETAYEEDEAADALLRFIHAWDAASPSWRVAAIKHIGVDGVWDAIAETIK